VVRVPWNDMVAMKRILDVGAQSLLIPYVSSAEEARAAVAHTRYPPTGVRGVAGTTRATRFGRIKDYARRAHEEICVLVQVETQAALDSIEAICAIDGIEPELRAPAAITEAARRLDAPAREAVLTFCALLGSTIGDLITVSSAKSVFIAGGILPQLKDFVPDSPFHARMLDKGVMRPVLETVPVRLIENERLGVIGAASWYLEHARDAHGDAGRPIA